MFEVPGEPRAKGRPRFARRGKFVTTYTDEKTATYENLVKLAAAAAKSAEGWEIPAAPAAYSVAITAILPIPQSWPKWRQEHARTQQIFPKGADCDNYAKSVLDGCNGVLWADDTEVSKLSVEKMFGPVPRLLVRVVMRELPTRGASA